MNQPTPAIVTQSAVRRLPRLALLLFCVAYIVPGFVGREPWKNADMTAFGFMFELAGGKANWLAPSLVGQSPEFDALLPYWLGAWAIKLAPAAVGADFAARVPFALLLALALAAVWYGVYYLARSPRAQPVAFAFGGEAQPTDYARAVADGGLLAMIACLGLAQLGHETTPSLAQLAFAALSFYAMAALPYRALGPSIALVLGLGGLALSGAPSLALAMGTGGLLISLSDRADWEDDAQRRAALWVMAAALALTALLCLALGLWRWRLGGWWWASDRWAAGRLLLWFTWPAWPLALWTLWRWRRQLASRHVAIPLWLALTCTASALATAPPDRSLLLALPALAALAAFALPTLQRSVSALIDWFTLLFFSGCAIIIWVVWLAMQVGIPAQPAANVARLAPGFVPSFSLIAFACALAATLAWGWLVKWRTGRHRDVIWKSVVLPAGGAALCWLLLMTLWLPLLDYARSYVPGVTKAVRLMQSASCVETHGLSQGQLAALRFHGSLALRPAGVTPICPWLLTDAAALQSLSIAADLRRWERVELIRRPTDADDNLVLFRRAPVP